MELRLIPIANEVLAAWPEYKYATNNRREWRQKSSKVWRSAYHED